MRNFGLTQQYNQNSRNLLHKMTDVASKSITREIQVTPFKQKKIQSGNNDEGSSENHNRQFRRVLQCTKNPFRTYLEFDRYTTPRLDREGSEKKRRTFPMCQLNTNFEVILNSN